MIELLEKLFDAIDEWVHPAFFPCWVAMAFILAVPCAICMIITRALLEIM